MVSYRRMGGTVHRTPTIQIFKLFLVLAVVIVAWAQAYQPAYAHANLVISDPMHGAVLPVAPNSLIFEFTETLDPGLTQVDLYDVNNILILSGSGEIAADNPELLRFPLEPLPDGTYSAHWTVRSTVDGHITTGVVSFSIGADSELPSLLPPVGAPDPASDPPPLLETAIRWLVYTLALLAVGIPLFMWFVWQPTVSQTRQAETSERIDTSDLTLAQMLRRFNLVIGLALVLALVMLIAYLAREATPNRAIGIWLGEIVYLTRGVLGVSLLLAILLILVVWKLYPGVRHSEMWPIATGLGLPLLFTFSLRGHGAAGELWVAVAMDWLHMASAAAWLGSLLPLALAIRTAQRHGTPALNTLVARFSRVALVSVVLIALTGLYSSLVHVKTLEALRITTYGQLVMLKTAIFAGLFVLGAINLLILSPRLRRIPQAAGIWLGRTMSVELMLGAFVILIAGALLATPPAYEALEARGRQGYVQTVREDQVRLTLRVAPARPGDNEFGIEFNDPRPGVDEAEPTIVLRLIQPGGTLDEQTEVETERQNGGRYTARGAYFSAIGDWQVEVIMRRRGFDDIRHTFVVTVEPIQVGPENPIEATRESIALGNELYVENCVPCHGVSGKGDGPVGLSLNPPPADLTQHTEPGLHSDGQLWLWITNGYPGSPIMPAFKDALTDEERWHLVNYIRTLGQEE